MTSETPLSADEQSVSPKALRDVADKLDSMDETLRYLTPHAPGVTSDVKEGALKVFTSDAMQQNLRRWADQMETHTGLGIENDTELTEAQQAKVEQQVSDDILCQLRVNAKFLQGRTLLHDCITAIEARDAELERLRAEVKRLASRSCATCDSGHAVDERGVTCAWLSIIVKPDHHCARWEARCEH